MELYLKDNEADYLGIRAAIKEKCPSFNPIETYRTPHAGILYILFEADTEDVLKILEFCSKSDIHVSVYNNEGTLQYRFGTNSDERLMDSIQV